MRLFDRLIVRLITAGGVASAVGCSTNQIAVPNGHMPPPTAILDTHTSTALGTDLPRVLIPSPPDGTPKKLVFDLPANLPGSNTAPLQLKFDKNTTVEERDRKVRETYPALKPVSANLLMTDRPPVSLAELQQLALTNNPSIKQASANADAVHGQVIQAGLHPNPTVGYQADQIQPSLRLPPGSTASGAGQQGGYINQLIKTAGKLGYAQQVVGYDYVNALVAVRKAEVDVMATVRANYFAALVAQQSLEVNRAVAEMADEVYRLQLKQVAAGETAGYEPLPLHAQAVQARNAVIQAEAAHKAAWKQLAAAIGQPDLPHTMLAGRADAAVPLFEADGLKARVTEDHTEVLTARNSIAQARVNLTLQQRTSTPDLLFNNYQQYDNAAQTYQFGVQLGIQLPVSDRNQGNIRTAQAKIAAAGQQLAGTQNSLVGKLAEAMGRYESNTVIATSYRDQVLPSLTQAYRGVIRRYQVEPEKVGFNDIVVAQQSLSQALQSYLTVLSAQWQAVVDVANIAQMDDLYPPASPLRN